MGTAEPPENTVGDSFPPPGITRIQLQFRCQTDDQDEKLRLVGLKGKWDRLLFLNFP